MVVFEPEPSPLLRTFVASQDKTNSVLLRPWRLPMPLQALAPGPLSRFVSQRCVKEGKAVPGFPLLELATRMWAGSRTDRTLHSRFVLRRLTAQWAAAQSCVRQAKKVIAPSCAARALFAAAPKAKKILLLDMPALRTMHEDLDAAASENADSVYLHRYRAPDWVLVNQEVEWQLADAIYTRGRFAREVLLARGVPSEKIFQMHGESQSPIPYVARNDKSEVRVLLAGLATARHGTHQLLAALESRPWLHVYARSGEGSEPAEFVQHPRVRSATADSLAEVDALIVPSYCETYLPEVSRAKACGVPVIATLRGAGALEAVDLFAELGPALSHSVPLALDQLRAAVARGSLGDPT